MIYLSIGILLFMFAIFFFNTKISALETRLKHSNEQLERIGQQLGVPEHPINNELRKLIDEGKEIKAIKEARIAMGLSLLEGKRYVESLKK